MALPVLHCSFPAILCASALIAFTFESSPDASAQGAKPEKKPKPTISVRSNPVMGFSPARVVLTAEVRGGPDDYEEFYCATVEWDWGDDTRSESREDCEPYVAGKSEIRRRFTVDHVFNNAGEFRVEFRLKQKNKIVGRGNVDVKVRPGIRDGAYDRD
jgi:hypothetical protein